ncbi:MAG TPA: N-acetylmuramoyl-L-alanine amidase [Bacillota bacterium]|nr:N-acetylmuramoyl-L-alanine amidase [Bacillota bacterium]
MKVFIIKRGRLGLLLLGMMTGLGFWFAHFPQFQTVFTPLKKEAPIVDPRVPNQPLQNKNIVIGIDPGHGGIDSGTKWGNMFEKDLNLKFSQKLREGLKKKGYRVVLTRNQDLLLTPLAHYSNKTRPYKLDEFQRRIQKLKAAKASVIVCIHANWHKLAYHRGPVAYYSSLSPVSQKIARHVQKHLNQIQPFRKLPRPSKYYLLEKAQVPAILIELGFFSNWEDRKLLQDEAYLEQLKFAIIGGLEATL